MRIPRIPMRIKIGNVEMDIDPQDLRKLLGMEGGLESISQASVPVELSHEPTHVVNVRSTPEDKSSKAQKGIELLEEIGLSRHTIVMIARKILHVGTTGKRLGDSYDAIAGRAAQWLTRPIKHVCPVLFVDEIKITGGRGFAAVGLNAENQMIILAIEQGSDPLSALKKLQARGLRTNSVELLVLPLNDKIEEAATTVFPKAVIQRDWLSVIAAAPPALRPTIKDMMLESSVNGTKAKLKMASKANPEIRDYVEPYLDELLRYFDFDKKLWRVLRALTPIERLESELTRKSKKAPAAEAKILVSWIALRLQFHWLKIPVDSPQLSNLRYNKEQADTGVASVRVPTQKSYIRRRPSESKDR